MRRAHTSERVLRSRVLCLRSLRFPAPLTPADALHTLPFPSLALPEQFHGLRRLCLGGEAAAVAEGEGADEGEGDGEGEGGGLGERGFAESLALCLPWGDSAALAELGIGPGASGGGGGGAAAPAGTSAGAGAGLGAAPLPAPGQSAPSGGKSGARFERSLDGRLVLKGLSRTEFVSGAEQARARKRTQKRKNAPGLPPALSCVASHPPYSRPSPALRPPPGIASLRFASLRFASRRFASLRHHALQDHFTLHIAAPYFAHMHGTLAEGRPSLLAKILGVYKVVVQTLSPAQQQQHLAQQQYQQQQAQRHQQQQAHAQAQAQAQAHAQAQAALAPAEAPASALAAAAAPAPTAAAGGAGSQLLQAQANAPHAAQSSAPSAGSSSAGALAAPLSLPPASSASSSAPASSSSSSSAPAPSRETHYVIVMEDLFAGTHARIAPGHKFDLKGKARAQKRPVPSPAHAHAHAPAERAAPSHLLARAQPPQSPVLVGERFNPFAEHAAEASSGAAVAAAAAMAGEAPPAAAGEEASGGAGGASSSLIAAAVVGGDDAAAGGSDAAAAGPPAASASAAPPAVTAAPTAAPAPLPAAGGAGFSAGIGASDLVLFDADLMALTRGFPLPLAPASRRRLDAALRRDLAFLEACDVVDYSLLVGLEGEEGEGGGGGGGEGGGGAGAGAGAGPSQLRVGIIDYLRRFDIVKRVENRVKAVAQLGVEPTIVKPQRYAERLLRACERYFAEVPEA